VVCETAEEIFFSDNMACCTLLFSVPSYLSHTSLLIFAFLPRSFDEVSVGKHIVWQSGRLHVTGYMTFLALSLSSILCGNSKCITPCNPNFGEVLGYLQEVL
jgi:hypothetical protein